MEGIAGVASVEQLMPGRFEWETARGWTTAQVASAASAALAAGFDEVIIADGHGNAQNLLPDRLPKGTRLVRSWPRPLGQMQGVELSGVEGCLFTGFHAGAASGAGTAEALRQPRPAPFRLYGPHLVEIVYTHPVAAELAALLPGFRQTGQMSVSVTLPTMRAVMEMLGFLGSYPRG